ncbi:MAG: ABC transporter ATP-binding protein [Wujia sp.]
MGAIKVENIKKSFGNTEILKGINLEIKDSSFTIILGPSGCGKTTLLRIISGLEQEDSGEIFISDKNITRVEPKDRHVAMVFQNYALYPHMDVYKNVEYSLKIKRVPKAERKEKVMEALRIVGLEDQVKKLPAQMSGGQRQRVALARAIVKNPDVFLMDEPLSNLDAKLRNQMRHSILELHKKLGTTFVYVTHDQTEAMTMGDNIVLMNEGHIVQQGSPKEMYTNPNHIFVAGFIGNPPTNIIKTDFGYLGIRPEDLHIKPATKRDYVIKGQINIAEPIGSEILYDVTSEKLGRIHVKVDNQWEEIPDVITVYVSPEKVLYFGEDGSRIYEPDEKMKNHAMLC